MFWSTFQSLVRSVNHFGPHEWSLVSIGVLVLGFLCLRGLVSHTRP